MVKNKKNISGFTLIELLAVVAIIALLVGMVIFAVNNLFNSSRESASEVSEEAIKKSAVTYANENYSSDSYWVKSNTGDSEYACVPILELVNKGYLKQKDIDDHGKKWRFIKVNRYASNKTIFSEEKGDSVCFWGTDGTKGTGIIPIKKTTTSVEVQSYCIPGDDVKGISFALASKAFNDNMVSVNSAGKYVYDFLGLISGSTYVFKARCNYSNGTSAEEGITDEITIGTMDYYFSLPEGDTIKLNDSVGEIYKTIEVNFNSENVTEPSYYFKSSSSNTFSNKEVMVCGNGKEPLTNCSDYSSQVSGYNGVKLEEGYWYKLKDITLIDEDTDKYSDSVKLEVYNNSTISIIGHDGNEFLDGKSTQMTFKSNPYVVLNISHSKYDDFKDSFLGGDNEVPFYSDNWMSMPTISWQVYGGYNTKSYVYYSNSTDNYDSMGKYKTSNVVSGYNGKTNCNDVGKCYLDADNFTKGGMQEIGIVVVNVATKKETVIRVQVNIDKKVPVITIVNDSGGKWTNQDVITTVSYDDDHSGINLNTLAWKKGSGSYTTYTDNASNSSSRVDTWPATSTWAGEYTVYYKICDNADNCSTVNTPIKIDITPPTISINNSSGGSWTNKDITTTISYSDKGGSKINPNTLAWKKGSGSYTTYTDNASNSSSRVDTWPASSTWAGEYTAYYKICDYAGNCSTDDTPIKIDITKPTISINNSSGGNWTNKDITTTISYSDSGGSKIKPSTLAWKSTKSGFTSYTTYTSNTNATSKEDVWNKNTWAGNSTATYKICDNAGNCKTATTSIKIDITPPTISIDNSSDGNWTNKAVTTTISYSDKGGSKINPNTLAWKKGSGSYTTYTDNASNSSSRVDTWPASSTWAGEYTAYYKICDYASNCSTDDTPIKIDITLPTPPTEAEIIDGKIVLTGSDDTGGSGLKNDRISFYCSTSDTCGSLKKDYYVSSVSLSDFTTIGTYWFGTNSDDNAGNYSGYGSVTGAQGNLIVANKVTSSWYECSSGYVSGAYCINYYNVSSSTSCKSCSYYSSDCTCARFNRDSCPSKCRRSYSSASSCNGAGYMWNSEGYCWSYYAYGQNCSACGSTTTYSCPSGWTYNSNGYCWKWATSKSGTSCADGYTEGSNGLCYKLS